jgi:hypothetical protein
LKTKRIKNGEQMATKGVRVAIDGAFTLEVEIE